MLEINDGRMAYLLVQIVKSTLVAALEIQRPVVLLSHIRIGIHRDCFALKLGILQPSPLIKVFIRYYE